MKAMGSTKAYWRRKKKQEAERRMLGFWRSSALEMIPLNSSNRLAFTVVRCWVDIFFRLYGHCYCKIAA